MLLSTYLESAMSYNYYTLYIVGYNFKYSTTDIIFKNNSPLNNSTITNYSSVMLYLKNQKNSLLITV